MMRDSVMFCDPGYIRLCCVGLTVCRAVRLCDPIPTCMVAIYIFFTGSIHTCIGSMGTCCHTANAVRNRLLLCDRCSAGGCDGQCRKVCGRLQGVCCCNRQMLSDVTAQSSKYCIVMRSATAVMTVNAKDDCFKRM
jgi:hypothetical protein